MYTIKRTAELVGIPAATLRAWQRRYGVVHPSRSDAGYRLYTDADVATLRRMRALVGQGLSPAVAASTVRPVTEEQGTDLVAAAASHRPGRISALLDQQFATASFEHVVDQWLMPQLRRVGHSWATGQLTVLGEHLVSSAVQRRLHAAFDAAGTDSPASTPTVLTGLPHGARHELGILAFAVCLRRLGVAVSHLGSNLPTAEWLAARTEYGSRAVALAVPTVGDLASARETMRALRRVQTPLLAVGGGQQDALAAEEPWLIPLGHRVAPAALHLADRLNALPHSSPRHQELTR